MRRVLLIACTFLFTALFVRYGAAACSSFLDCPSCHVCNEATMTCVAVMNFTDPNGECPVYCGVKTVCDTVQVCAYKERPECTCDWLSGECVRGEQSMMLKPINDITLSTLTTGGYSDSEIKMILAILERELEHKKQYGSDEEEGVTVIHHGEDLLGMRVVLGINCILLVGAVISALYIKCLIVNLSMQIQAKKD